MKPVDDILEAARMLESGRLVAFPTETVYGLGGDAENPAAVAAIFALKNRPADHPLIVHVAPEADVGYWAAHVPDAAAALMKAFWPGPLTLILKRAAHIPPDVAGGQDSIGLRCPSHPVAPAGKRWRGSTFGQPFRSCQSDDGAACQGRIRCGCQVGYGSGRRTE